MGRVGAEARAPRWRLALWLAAAAAGVLVFLPSLTLGPVLDDYCHLAILDGLDPAAEVPILDLWNWAEGGSTLLFADDPQGGWLPWYAADDLRIAFLRPLSALAHLLDHRLHGSELAGWRWTSLGLWLALLAVTGGLYVELDRLDGGRSGVAPLALLLFALDEAHAWNLGWLATRHGLLATLLAVAAVLGHLRWRRRGRRRDRVLALAALVLALGCSEVGVGAFAWVVALEVLLPATAEGAVGSAIADRVRGLAPFAAVAVAYVAVHRALGYGVRGLAWYHDPLSDPVGFLATLPERGGLLLMGLLSPVPAEAAMLGRGPAVAAGLAVALVVAMALVLWSWRRPPARAVGVAVLLTLGVAAIPPPLNYLLLLPSVGAMWLLAGLLRDLAPWASGEGSRGLRAVGAVVWLVVLALHLVVAPWRLTSGYAQLEQQHRDLETMVRTADPGAAAGGARVLVVTTGHALATLYLPLVWRVVAANDPPAAVWVLSSAWGRHRLHRTAAASFELTVPGEGAGPTPWDDIVRARSTVEAGVYRQGGMTVTVAEGGPSVGRLEVALDRPLDDPTVEILAWDGQRLARVQPPPVGDEIAVGPHPFLGHLMQRQSR